jgi:ectoine hydroxylase-related dioxygenase (phytanoyl-CoA dioxygenase family)
MEKYILSYGIKEKNKNNSDIEKHVEALSIKGFTIIDDLIPLADLNQFRKILDDIYQTQVNEIGGEEKLKVINDEFIVRCPLAYNKLFLGIATYPEILKIVNAVLGDYYILMLQNGIINIPSKFNFQASWHRDLNYQHFVSTRPLSLSVLFCLDDFTDLTGGTYFLPATHKVEKFPSDEYIAANEVTIEAKAGSAIIFDSMIFHRAGHNRSLNIRRGVNHMYTLPFIKQQISIPNMLGENYTKDQELLKFLGYESQTGNSVMEWRKNKLVKSESINSNND